MITVVKEMMITWGCVLTAVKWSIILLSPQPLFLSNIAPQDISVVSIFLLLPFTDRTLYC